MPNERNFYLKEVEGKYIEEPLLVTVSLEEYRGLVQENIRLEERVHYLENRLLEEQKKERC